MAAQIGSSSSSSGSGSGSPTPPRLTAAEDRGGTVYPKLDCPHIHTDFDKAVVDARLASSALQGLSCPCVDCGDRRENWLCLCCGEVACGRYVEGHMEQHWLAHHTDDADAASSRSSSSSSASNCSSAAPAAPAAAAAAGTHSLCVSMTDLSVWCNACGSYVKDDSLLDSLQRAEAAKFDRDGIPA